MFYNDHHDDAGEGLDVGLYHGMRRANGRQYPGRTPIAMEYSPRPSRILMAGISIDSICS